MSGVNYVGSMQQVSNEGEVAGDGLMKYKEAINRDMIAWSGYAVDLTEKGEVTNDHLPTHYWLEVEALTDEFLRETADVEVANEIAAIVSDYFVACDKKYDELQQIQNQTQYYIRKVVARARNEPTTSDEEDDDDDADEPPRKLAKQ